MLTDWKIVQKKILNLLKTSPNELAFFRNGKLIEVCNKEQIQITEIIEGEFFDSFNYEVKGEGGIGILTDELGCLTTHRTFKLILKVEGDDIIAIKDNRIEIIDK